MNDGYVCKTVETGIASVLVNYSPVSGLEVTVWPTNDIPNRVQATVGGGGVAVTRVRFGRLPRVGDEVTQDGRTFEVTAVKEMDDGSVHVRTDSGVWVKYEEV